MRQDPSSKQGIINEQNSGIMETTEEEPHHRHHNHHHHKLKQQQADHLHHQDQQPHLSGAYIRSLVKQLTSSKTTSKDPSPPPPPPPPPINNNPTLQNHSRPPSSLTPKAGEEGSGESTAPQPTHKKQVRRRLHSTRPYQERLLNMAEARREIVTALKYHRATMKQQEANHQNHHHHHQQTEPPLRPLSPFPSLEQAESKIRSHRNTRIYPSSVSSAVGRDPNIPTDIYNFEFSYPSSCFYPSPPPPPPPATLLAPLPLAENLNLALPNQTLGLNLNFHDFSNLSTSLSHPSIFSPSPSPSPSTPSSSSPFPTAAAGGGESGAMGGGGGLHQAMDEEEMAEIRSIGEQHEMEWNDTVNLVTSAWWFKFLKSMEFGTEATVEDDNNYPYPFEELVEFEFPNWLSANERYSLQQQHLEYDLHESALPCMDIGEIEAVDGEWLSILKRDLTWSTLQVSHHTLHYLNPAKLNPLLSSELAATSPNRPLQPSVLDNCIVSEHG
ncbi:formin-like protein 14 [Malania oleifera]|uniref:formin-like protein 14 n=1 Tax=Malania oleifera TaxID=397392 RepID=UPI0025ADAEF5|nr:formin-like protein 14 [Malania oleifera]